MKSASSSEARVRATHPKSAHPIRPIAAAVVAIGLLTGGPAIAEDSPPIAITHARVYVPGNRPPLEDATVVVANGRILSVGPAAKAPASARTIDARGKVVTPGFIDANTDVGVVDVELEPEANDTDVRGGPLTPALRMVDGYNPRSTVVDIARSGGVTSVIVAPRSNLLGGQGAFVDLAGDSVSDAVVRPSLGQYARVDDDTVQTDAGTRSGLWLMLREALDDARFYGAHRGQYDTNASRPLRLSRQGLEALQPVLRGEQPLVITAHRAGDIEAAMRLADDFKLKLVVEGASEAWLVADELAKRKIPVVIDPLENLPARFDRLHARSANATLLADAGVAVVISTFSADEVRLLWQHAGNAVRLGMDHDAAIRAVTEAPADAFGLKGYGRIEPGAVANVVVWSGDPFQTSTHVEHVLVRGRERILETRQTLLLRRYRTVPPVRDGTR
ncbi:MAG TPA: amidohydrolase family protein [Polyangiaceae bacterium]|nr:amidohydrolase family protein [Polyangiaceae bacterium]